MLGVGGRQPLVLWVSVLSEIEGLAFVAVGVLLQRVDLFLDSQPALLPAAVFVATLTALVAVWAPRRRPIRPAPAIDSAEAVADLAGRIGALAPQPPAAPLGADPPQAAWRRALDQRH